GHSISVGFSDVLAAAIHRFSDSVKSFSILGSTTYEERTATKTEVIVYTLASTSLYVPSASFLTVSRPYSTACSSKDILAFRFHSSRLAIPAVMASRLYVRA